MDVFKVLPEECVSEILSRTSWKDAAKSSVVSKRFKFAADSDVVWDKFLPSDHRKILSRASPPVVFRRKKDLYYRLCYYPVLLDDGNLSFWLDPTYGKKCYMVGGNGPSGLSIISEDTGRWEWTSDSNSRFGKVATFHAVCWLDIRGTIQTDMLSKNTEYDAYLVYRLAENHSGLELGNGVVSWELEKEDEKITSVVYFEDESASPRNRVLKGKTPRRRDDEWMEIELGNLVTKGGESEKVEARFMEIRRLHWKCGLVVQGIEFRPR